ncbi:tripartite tricarboxylate transporter substrate binding protein [Variovorax sp. KK3]|uniref:Bug family tripartite tricarboxylate transporter substrate binding protein n=1 Tax=Variovorax sp. KK3 TaxID=1855728 RepID=UPI00097C0300|nr:tripartite tricarboxylate transporter substrate binding protein [Variovorax sp. KK3]
MKTRKHTKRHAVALIVATALAAWSGASMAQAAWPTKPIRLIVAGPPGGTADALARQAAEGLKGEGQPVVVEAKPGGSGVIAINDLLANGQDGHTLLVIQVGAVSEMPLVNKVKFKPFADLKPLAQISRTGLVLVANKSLGLTRIDDVVKYGQSQKDGVDFASYATGMKGHTLGMQFGHLSKVKMRHVPYKGSPQALVDLMGGQVPLMFDGVTTSLPLIKSGKIDAIAVSYPTRIGALPEVPTFKELGYPQLAQASWFAVWSRPDVAPEIQQKIRAATLKHFDQASVKRSLRDMGMEPGEPLSSQAMMADAKAAYDEQAALLKAIDFQPE